MKKVAYKLVELFDEIEVLKKMFDSVEIIEPISETIVDCNEYQIKNTKEECKKTCLIGKRKGDCVCKQVVSTESTYTTFQFDNKDSYYTMSRPIKVKGKTYVMQIVSKITAQLSLSGVGSTELVKNITKYSKGIHTDELTGAFNRKFVAENMHAIIEKAKREGINVCVGCVDIDNFKKFNDKYGHAFGDLVLKSVTNSMRAVAKRSEDYIIRIGGDEFVIVMQEIDKKQFIKKMNQCCEIVDDLRLKTDKGEIARICISIGCSSLIEDGLDDYESLAIQADKKLYVSKEKGKNCAT